MIIRGHFKVPIPCGTFVESASVMTVSDLKIAMLAVARILTVLNESDGGRNMSRYHARWIRHISLRGAQEVQQWIAYKPALSYYGVILAYDYKRRTGNSKPFAKFLEAHNRCSMEDSLNSRSTVMPPWLSWPRLLRTSQSVLYMNEERRNMSKAIFGCIKDTNARNVQRCTRRGQRHFVPMPLCRQNYLESRGWQEYFNDNSRNSLRHLWRTLEVEHNVRRTFNHYQEYCFDRVDDEAIIPTIGSDSC